MVLQTAGGGGTIFVTARAVPLTPVAASGACANLSEAWAYCCLQDGVGRVSRCPNVAAMRTSNTGKPTRGPRRLEFVESHIELAQFIIQVLARTLLQRTPTLQ
jgi:hypothetical protein